MAKLLPLSLSLCFLLFSGCFAFRMQPQQNECQLERLNALKPDNRMESEAGLIETWNPNNKQFRCAGVAFSRCTLQCNGLRRPFYSNAPEEIFIQQGNGMFGMIFPGCPETYEEPQESQGQQRKGRRVRDSHQKVQRFREGDVIAVPTGVVFWMYNDQDTPVIAVSLIDTSSFQNQLDNQPRRFYLAGNQEQEFLQYQQQQKRKREENEGGNIFSGFNREFLEDVLKVDSHIVKSLQGKNEEEDKGAIVKVKGGLSIVSPPEKQPRQSQREEEEEEEEEEESHHRRRRSGSRSQRDNGLEETICTIRLHQNIGKYSSPDIYNPQAGSIKTLSSLDFPALGWLRLSAEHGSLHKNAMFVPHYNINANSIIYGLKGRAWIQVVNCTGDRVFDGEVEEGRVLIVPQNYAVAARSLSERFVYVAFKTSDRAMIATLTGGTSMLKALPEEVIQHSFNLRKDEAKQVKFNNPFKFLVPPRQSEDKAAA